MFIKLAHLEEGTHIFTEKDNAETVGLDKEMFAEDVSIKVTVDKRGVNYYLNILSSAVGEFCCDRCLEKFTKEIISESNIIYTEDITLVDMKDKDELRYIRNEEEDIDISEDIRQLISLSVPLKMLCSEKCKGLCPHCGKNLNFGGCDCKNEIIDPRWEKLKGLKFNINKKE